MDIEKVVTTGCSFKIKSKDLDKAAVNECVYDMFGAATKLLTMALDLGKLVDKVHMYGLLVSMKDTNAAGLLKLDINLLYGTCDFKMTHKKYGFIDGANMILHKL